MYQLAGVCTGTYWLKEYSEYIAIDEFPLPVCKAYSA
jgi:hypothetical protein